MNLTYRYISIVSSSNKWSYMVMSLDAGLKFFPVLSCAIFPFSLSKVTRAVTFMTSVNGMFLRVNSCLISGIETILDTFE